MQLIVKFETDKHEVELSLQKLLEVAGIKADEQKLQVAVMKLLSQQ